MSRRAAVGVAHLGCMSYTNALNVQKRIGEVIRKKDALYAGSNLFDLSPDGVLLTVEHPHVYTLGRKCKTKQNLLETESYLASIGAEVHITDRGGDITYHGPGQVVGYPILDLKRFKTDLHWYVRQLEEVMIRTASNYSVELDRCEGLTGVWKGKKKVGAVGVNASQWVTIHGFALNVDPDLTYFNHIVPCGIDEDGRTVSSICLETQQDVPFSEAIDKVSNSFAEVFERDTFNLDISQLDIWSEQG